MNSVVWYFHYLKIFLENFTQLSKTICNLNNGESRRKTIYFVRFVLLTYLPKTLLSVIISVMILIFM